jgi:glutathione S-transferase
MEQRARHTPVQGKILTERDNAVANDLTLWGSGTTRTMRPHWMLMELGLDYRFHPIGARTGETLAPEFRRINPRHKIPVLQHGSFVLTESAAIVQYLGETFQSPALFAANNAAERAKLNEWCYFVISELDAASLYIVRRHAGLKDIYGEAPTAVDAAKNYFSHNLEAMASRIGVESPYLLGDRLSAADILLVTCLDWALAEGLALPDTVMEYRQRITRRAAYRDAFARNYADDRSKR